MRDFTSANAPKKQPGADPPAQPAQHSLSFGSNDEGDDDDPMIAAMKSSIAANLGPMGVTSISFVEDADLIKARAQIRGDEARYEHISDGSYDRMLCGYETVVVAVTGAPQCPVCEWLDC